MTRLCTRIHRTRLGTALAVAGAIAGCASPPVPPPPAAVVPAPAEPAPPPTAAKPELQSQPLRHLVGRHLEPMPDRPLNVRAQCSFRDPNGYRGRLTLEVRDAQVRRFEAQVFVPKRGDCRFALKDFRQTAGQPTVTLTEDEADCAVHIWEEPSRVTVAFGECRHHCGGDARDYLWPILVNARAGTCS